MILNKGKRVVLTIFVLSILAFLAIDLPTSTEASTQTTPTTVEIVFTGGINISVLDSSGNPLQSASVYIYNSTLDLVDNGTTNSSGLYLSGNLISGNYTVNANKTGYREGNASAEVNPPNITHVSVTLSASSSYIPEGGPGGLLVPPTPRESLKVDIDLVSISLKQGDIGRDFLTIENMGETTLEITIDKSELDKFLVIDYTRFTLQAGEGKTIKIDIVAGEDAEPGTHVGRIYIIAEGIRIPVNVIIDITEKAALFDTNLEVLDQYKIVEAGSVAKAIINLINMGDVEKVDVYLYYAIKDFNGTTITFARETISMETTHTAIIRDRTVPHLTPPGRYIFYATVNYGGRITAASDDFEVIEGPPSSGGGGEEFVVVMLSLTGILVAIIFSIKYYPTIGKH